MSNINMPKKVSIEIELKGRDSEFEKPSPKDKKELSKVFSGEEFKF